MPHIRLIALDLDGTLLDSSRRLSPGAAEAVALARSAGVAVCLASGRALSTILPYADQLGLAGPIVSCNGAYVVGADRSEIHHSALGPAAAGAILDYAASCDVHTNLYTREAVYFSHDGEWASVYRDRTGVRENGVAGFGELRGIAATKILFIDRREAILRHQAETSKLLDSGGANVVLSESEYVEFLPQGIDKASGLRHAASALSLHQGEVAAIGDYYNDLEMVRWAGFSGAVRNGALEVREQADLVVASNDEGGAAEFILAALRYEPEL